MKAPRLSLATIGIGILILAIDLAVARVALFGPDSQSWANFALCLLPMINLLMIGLYRLRRRERRTARALGFMLAGLAGTIVVFALCLIAPDTAWWMFNATITSLFHGLVPIFGNAVMHHGAMNLMIGIGLEFPFPMMFFCVPPLVAACFGGWLAKRLGTEEPIARAVSLGRDPACWTFAGSGPFGVPCSRPREHAADVERADDMLTQT